MSDYSALLEAVRANPAEDTPRLVLADWLSEFGNEQQQATAEFIRLSCRGAKALPVAAGAWLLTIQYPLTRIVTPQANWKRLVPTFAAWVEKYPGGLQWPHVVMRREGRWVTAHAAYGPTYSRAGWAERVDLEFHRGFVRRVVCRDWRFWDVVGPLLLPDCPLMEPELTGGIQSHQNGVSEIGRQHIGPAFGFIDLDDYVSAPMTWALFKSAERARLALAKALTLRAEAVRAGTAKAGVNVVANAEAAEVGGEGG